MPKNSSNEPWVIPTCMVSDGGMKSERVAHEFVVGVDDGTTLIALLDALDGRGRNVAAEVVHEDRLVVGLGLAVHKLLGSNDFGVGRLTEGEELRRAVA